MKNKRASGFTIIELMLTIAVAGVLLGIGVPAFRDMVANNCLTTKTNAMVSAMQLARSSAITLRDDVTIGARDCRMDENNDDSADGSCASADEFGNGIVVYRDIDSDGLADTLIEDLNGNGVLDVGEDINANGRLDTELIRDFAFACEATLNETSNQTALTYTLKGFAAAAATINVCDNRASSDYKGREVELSVTGRPKTDSQFTCP